VSADSGRGAAAAFRTNFSYLYGTLDASTAGAAQEGSGIPVDVVHLTHLTTAGSIFHQLLGIASLASAPLAATKATPPQHGGARVPACRAHVVPWDVRVGGLLGGEAQHRDMVCSKIHIVPGKLPTDRDIIDVVIFQS
jgi:hypothetical protein